MLTVMMVITGNVQSTSVENEGPSELVLFLRITKSHCHTGCISSSCGRLTSPTKDFETPAPWNFYTAKLNWVAEERRWKSTSLCLANNVSPSTWVFGMVKRGTGWTLAFQCTQQNERNLGGWSGTTIRRAWATIISNKFSPYFNLNSLGYIHVMVDNSENFVDPFTRAHSNTIEGVWSKVKK